jgi:ribosome biogenesis protein ENP2
LSLSFARHTDTLNEKFVLLSSDYTKSLHLQVDRAIEFHTAGGRHYSTRIPRFGRDIIYDRRSTEALIPSVGFNSDHHGEVFRLNLEIGRFMKGYDIDIGDAGAEGLQGGIDAGAVNVGAIAEESHNLLAFGTSIGTVEFWDPRSRARVGILGAPPSSSPSSGRAQITALAFHRSGLEFATGASDGLAHVYDLRSPVPLLKKDQGYDLPIKNLLYLTPSTQSRHADASISRIASVDKHMIKIWDAQTGAPWTSVETAVDLNHVAWVPDTGMLLTANEGRQQHSFFIPQLGPAPKWCSFLDNLVEEMAEDPNDPNAFSGAQRAGEVYDNYKFLTMPQLQSLNLDHFVGTTSLLRPYMHGYFIAQELYEEARLISKPELWKEQRAKSVKEKIDRERESRIRGPKAIKVKVNRKLAERLLQREEKAERRRAKKVLEQGGDEDIINDVQTDRASKIGDAEEVLEERNAKKDSVLADPRFAKLFQDEDYEVDEESHEFRAINPSTKAAPSAKPRGLTAVEQEELDSLRSPSSDDESEEGETLGIRQQRDENDASNRISSSNYKKSKRQIKSNQSHKPTMTVQSSVTKPRRQDKSFGHRMGDRHFRSSQSMPTVKSGGVVGEKEITFTPTSKKLKAKQHEQASDMNAKGGQRPDSRKDRRSASGNVFRRM